MIDAETILEAAQVFNIALANQGWHDLEIRVVVPARQWDRTTAEVAVYAAEAMRTGRRLIPVAPDDNEYTVTFATARIRFTFVKADAPPEPKP